MERSILEPEQTRQYINKNLMLRHVVKKKGATVFSINEGVIPLVKGLRDSLFVFLFLSVTKLYSILYSIFE